MNSLITVTFDPHAKSVQQSALDDFYARCGFERREPNGKYYRNGVEAEYQPGYRVTMSAAFPTAACDDAIVSATNLWREHGGSITASPELRDVIADIITMGM